MSQNNLSTTVTTYAGLDVHKASLPLHLAGRDHVLTNTAAGHRALLVLRRRHPGAHVVCEASGGFERPIVAALHAVEVPVSVLNPACARHLARALGPRASHRLASLCLPCGGSRRPSSANAKRPSPSSTRCSRKPLRPPKNWRPRLSSCAGCRAWVAQTVLVLLAELPELGQLGGSQLAALAGVAPHPRRSGAWIGQRHISGGRAPVRKALYMASLTTVRLYAPLRAFYQRLRAAGKPAKVALTAAMRKLRLLLNSLLKNPHFILAS